MKRLDLTLSLLLFSASFALYVRTLAPSLLFGDSAEFQTIAYTLGVGHPTGYPVYILLAKLFTFLPVGDVAYRVNLLSAIFAALAVALLYLIIRKLAAMRAAAVFGSLILALEPLFWKHATLAETYALSVACLLLILLFVLQWKTTRVPRGLFLAGLLGGLSLGIHGVVALSGIAILLYLVLSAHQRVDWVQASLGVLVGTAIFVSSFLFLDFLNSPAGYYNTVVGPSLSVWDMTAANFDSPFERLGFLYFPPQFKGQFLSVSWHEFITRLIDFAAVASWNLALALLGFIALLVPRPGAPARWREAILLIAAFVTFLTFAATYNVYDFYVYYIPAILVLAIFAGLGANVMVGAVASVPGLPRPMPVFLSIFILVAALYPSIADITLRWKDRIPPGLEDWESYFYHYPDANKLGAEEIVNGMEDNAIFFTDWDRVYDYYYIAHVLQGRTEMDFHETYPQEGVIQFADSAVEYIEANIGSRPIYFSERPFQLATRYRITKAGSGLFQIERK